MSNYYVYLARCADGSLYTGYCRDLTEREAKHNQGLGAKYTRGRLPVQVIYSEKFQHKDQAMRREAEIKRWSKEKKEFLVVQ